MFSFQSDKNATDILHILIMGKVEIDVLMGIFEIFEIFTEMFIE